MLYVDFGVEMASGLNGVGVRAVELAAALSRYQDVTVVTPDEPDPEILSVWSTQRYARPEDVKPVRGDVLWYGFATPPDRVRHFRERHAACVFDAIVWPLEYSTYESVRTSLNPPAAYSRHLDSYLLRLRLADRFTVASDLERQVLTGMLSILDQSRILSAGLDLSELFRILPVGFPRPTRLLHSRKTRQGQHGGQSLCGTEEFGTTMNPSQPSEH